MKIYENLVKSVSKEFIKKTINSGYLLISKARIRGAEKDIESIFLAYLATLKDIHQKTKDRIAKSDNLDNSSFNKIRKQIASEQRFALEKNNEKYLVKQVLAMVFQSDNIDDVMVDDKYLDRLFIATCKKYFISDEELDQEVRKRMYYFSNLKEGTKHYDRKFKEIKAKLEVAKGLRTSLPNRIKRY